LPFWEYRNKEAVFVENPIGVFMGYNMVIKTPKGSFILFKNKKR